MAKYENGNVVAHHSLGHAQVTVGASAVGLPDIPSGVGVDIRRIVIRNLAGDINWRDDGVDPTDSTGFPSYADEIMVFDGADAHLVRMIRAASSTEDADVRVIYYGI